MVADRLLLSSFFPIVQAAPGSGLVARARFAARLAVRLLRERPPLVVLWFASPTYGALTAALCRATSVPWVVLAGGAEVADRPGIGFGEARTRWRRRATANVLAGAWRVWAFSEAAADEIRHVARGRALALSVVPPVVDTAFFRPGTAPAELEGVPPSPAPVVLSACARLTSVTIRQKGIDRLLAVARALPAVTFVVTGALDEADASACRLCAAAPGNVRFAGFVSRDLLRALYARACVYLQLSDHEGFGVAVAEAVAMGVAPVTTDLPALRDLVGARGHLVPLDAPPGVVAAVVASAVREQPRDAAAAWADIDARFGPAVRLAAWRALLDEAARPTTAAPERRRSAGTS